MISLKMFELDPTMGVIPDVHWILSNFNIFDIIFN